LTEGVLGIEVKDDPIEFYYSMSGIVQEAMESLQEDTRWKEVVFRKPGYKFCYNRELKVIEIADIVLYWINGCLYSDFKPEEVARAILGLINMDISSWFGGNIHADETGLDSIHCMFVWREKSKDLRLEVDKENPVKFYHCINAIVAASQDCLKEDDRWNLSIPMNPMEKRVYHRGAKLMKLGNIFIKIIDICRSSGISSEELVAAVEGKTKKKIEKFITAE
jgi:hypothetical protein